MSELKEVLDKLGRMDEKLDEMLRWKAGLEERCTAHREKTEELRNEMFGTDGIKIKVQRLVNCKGAIGARIAVWRDFGMYVLKAIVVACLLAVIAFLLRLYKSG
ncbi:MAG: hypothetical protein GWN94_19860 [Phycisphaerae bacterium]|nr:hypothetical protein [Phycisphaerae bacterium]NIS53330.1 hypothetical protein [Phycisphaerae bacterium]NIX30484.1 hypothetical protein [Phycisphaerae bacterium]